METDYQYTSLVQHNGLEVVYNHDLGYAHLRPLPDEKAVEAYYENDQFYAGRTPHSSVEWFDKELSEYKAGLWDVYFNYLINLAAKGYYGRHRITDIGSGSGILIDYWTLKHPLADLVGIEPSKVAREWGERNSISTGFGIFESWDDIGREVWTGKESMDSITMVLVLEHIANPKAFLQEQLTYLQPGGQLLIVVPNDFNPLQLRLGYYGFISPVHINYFTPQALRNLMESAGLKIVHESSTFPIELFPLVGINYIGNDELGRRCHLWRLKFERLFGQAAFKLYEKLYNRWGIGRELIFVGEKVE